MAAFEIGWELATAHAAQIAILIVAVLVGSRLVSRRRPHLVHMLWLVVLLKCLIPPLMASPMGAFCWLWPAGSERASDAVGYASGTRGPSIELSNTPTSLIAPVDRGNEADIVVHPIPGPSSDRASKTVWQSTQSALAGISSGGMLGGVWIAGSLVVLGLAAIRWRACWRRILCGEVAVDPRLAEQLHELAGRLGMRRRVRLLVTEARVGPAVVGVMRPTLVMPAAIVRDATREELEPILAHELLHIRRGDLWVALLQVLSRALWWFHPLVWYANRMIVRAAERCCDEEALAALGCTPARYARSLLRVLELKRELAPVPAFPGVRAVDITQQRLERIMRSGQGCRRASWWCWLVLIAGAAVALPGARFVRTVAAEPQTQRKFLGVGVNSNAGLFGMVVRADPTTAPYESDFSSLLDGIQREFKVNRQAAREHLESVLSCRDISGESLPRISWKGDRIVISATREQLCRMNAAKKAMREYGFDQISVEVRFISGEPEKINRASKRWVVLSSKSGADTPSVTEDDRLPDDRWHNTAVFAVEKNPPVMLEVIDDARACELLAQYQQDRRINVLQAPRMQIFNAQTADVVDIAQTPFVVSVSRAVDAATEESSLKPQIRVCKSGVMVRLRPVLRGDTVELDCELLWSTIRNVENVDVRVGDTDETTQVQVPEVARARIAAQSDVPLGKTLLVGGLKQTDSKGKTESLLMLVKVTRPASDAPQPVAPHDKQQSQSALPNTDHRVRISSSIYPVTYPVADLVIPIPGKADLTEAAQTTPGPKPEPDFDTLVNRITSMVRPASWKKAGRPGRGSITPFPNNLSLVIVHEAEVHEEIAELLEKLRQPLRVQVAVGFRVLPPGKPADRDLHPLLPDETGTRLLPVASADQLATALGLTDSPKVTVFSGHPIVMSLPGVRFADVLTTVDPMSVDPHFSPTAIDLQAEAKIQVQPRVAADHASVELTVSVAMDDPGVAYRIDVPDGNSLVVDLAKLDRSDLKRDEQQEGEASPDRPAVANARRPKTPQYLLITPQIIIVEEDEDHLPGSEPRFPAGSNTSKLPFTLPISAR